MEFNIESTDLMGNQDILDILNDPKDASAAADPKTVTPVTKEPAKEEPKKEEPAEVNIIDSLFDAPKEKKEEKEESTKVDTKVPEPAAEAATEGFPASKLAKDFFELSLFTKEEGEEEPEITTPEQFVERVQLEKRKGAVEILENYIGRFGEDYQNAFDAIFNKGVNPREYFTTASKIDDYAAVDLTKESNQERIVREGLQEEGYEAEDIEAKIQKLKDYSDLEDESKRVQKLLVKKQTQKLEQTKVEAAETQAREAAEKQAYRTTVQTVLTEKLKSKDFDGIPLTPDLAKTVAASLVNENWQLPDGTKLTDFDKEILDLKRPENHSLKVKVALLLAVLKKDPTLSTIKKSVISEKAKTLFANTTGKSEKESEKSQPKKPVTDWGL